MRQNLRSGVCCLLLLAGGIGVVRGAEIEITYGYQGKGNAFLHLAGTAEAKSAGSLVGKATLLDIQSKQGSDGKEHVSLLEVEETHFSGSGAVTYKGKIFYSVPLGNKVREEKIEGTKSTEIFGSWPAGM